MKEQGFEERDIGLFLTLFERALNVLKVVEEKRDELLASLQGELTEQRKNVTPGERDEELIEQLQREITALNKGVRSEIFKLMKGYSVVDLNEAEAEKSSFAGPYIRTLLDFNKGNRHYTDHLKEQLTKLLQTSTQAIAAMKAWKSGELNGRGVTIESLVEKSRAKILGTSLTQVSTKSQPAQVSETQPVSSPTVASYMLNEEDLNTVYSFIPDNEHARISQSLQPDSFSLDEKKGFTRKQRRWIYSLFLLDLGDESGKVELRQHLADKIFKCTRAKVSAITAYLSGNLIAKAEKNKSEVWEDIKLIQEQKEWVDNKRKTPSKNNDNDSGGLEGSRSDDVLEKGKPDKSDATESKVAPENLGVRTDESIEMVSDYPSGKGGEHFDYNNEVKIEWRRALQTFIDKNTIPEERDKMRVLCLPGKKCLEIPVYTELGFNPANIVGVEGGSKEACDEFEKNAKAFGITHKLGRLERDVLSGEAPFDVVSLDFLGPMCPKYMDIISSIPFHQRALACVNVMAKRDDLRSTYQYMKSSFGIAGNLSASEGGYGDAFNYINRQTEAMIDCEMPEEVKNTRDDALLGIIMMSIASSFPSKFVELRDKLREFAMAPPTNVPQFKDAWFYPLLLSECALLGKIIFPLLFELKQTRLSVHLYHLVHRAWLNLPRLLSHEKYTYDSGKSPFSSHFMEVESSEELQKRNYQLISHILLKILGTLQIVTTCSPEIKALYGGSGWRELPGDSVLLEKAITNPSTLETYLSTHSNPFKSKRFRNKLKSIATVEVENHITFVRYPTLLSGIRDIKDFNSKDIYFNQNVEPSLRDVTRDYDKLM